MKCFRLPAIVLLLALFFISSVDQIKSQSASLENAAVISNTMDINTIAELEVTFKLPFNASPIRRVNYIQIELTNFVDITPATSITGPYTGTPQYTATEGYLKISGISVVPGATLTINGITARTPGTVPGWPASILITEDSTLTTLKNQAIVDVNLFQGNVTVSTYIDNPEARLSISGYTSPIAYVTFTKNQAVAGTDVSGSSGYFGKIFSGLPPDTHEYTFFATDQYQRTTSPVTITIYTPAYQETSITDQILSPTISINKSIYPDGEDIIASGSAVPNSTITIFTQAPLRIYSTTADGNGEWSYTITNTEEYVMGDYYIYSLAQSPLGLTSLNSLSLGFTIASTISNGTACGDITGGDLNCDDSTDLTDFSILMYYWGTTSAIADINTDNVVNLTDFSILMYWWGT